MTKRFLLTLVALALLLGLAFGVVWLVQNRRSAAPETAGGAGASLPESGTASPATEGQLGSSLACPERWTDLADADRDGLPDTVEALYTTNPENADADGDGYTDGAEVRAGYDPLQKEGNPRLDSDSDDLPENEECQWKTDPFNPDTDGDGFKDGDEVRNKFDPTIPGDGKGSDALPERRVLETQQSLERFRPNANSDNLTERLAAQLFGNRPISELTSFSPSPEDIRRVVEPLPRNTSLPTVGIGELTVDAENTPAVINRYLAAIGLAEPLGTNPASLADAFHNAFQGRPGVLAVTRRQLDGYAQVLRTTPVPPTALPYHRQLLGFVRFTTQRFQTVEENGTRDPVRAYLALRELQEGAPRYSPELASRRNDLVRIAQSTKTP